jgi:NAD(P)-dependent dehydrogenase (short-subunit alcohol dehydrogenase family)
VRALVTGGRGGIGRAIAEAYSTAEGGDVVALDLPEFDVSSREAWAALEGEFDAAFLNAGIGIGYPDVAELPDGELDRIVGANFLGVVYGTRECARRLMPRGGAIVATASLAGLTGMPFDPMYTATKHAVVGFVRGAAPGLAARGIRLNALCPGFTDTPIVEDELRGRLPAPLMEPSFVAQAALQALNDEEVGRAWIVQPNRVLPFSYPGIPGPRAGSGVGEADPAGRGARSRRRPRTSGGRSATAASGRA